MTSNDDQKVLMAKIGAAHGIQGEVRVKPFGDDPLSFTDYGSLTTKDGSQVFTVERARVQKTVVITKFKNIQNRNQAEELNGTELYLDRSALPDPDEDEFYHSDLVGLEVHTIDKDFLGKVVTVQDFGAGDLIEIRPKRGPTFYIPFTKEFVPSVNLEDAKLVVDLPEDYFSSEDEAPDM